MYTKGIFGLCANKGLGDGERLVSWSQYTRYKKCPKQWKLRYIDKHKILDQSIYLVYGTAMHEVIQKYLYVMYTDSVKAADSLNLQEMLGSELRKEYMKSYEESGVHFSDPVELSRYYEYGTQILKFLRKKRRRYFNSKTMELIGIELPIFNEPHPNYPKVKMQQYLDLVFYDKTVKKYTIIDIKTSTKGWNKWKRREKLTTDQVVLYKYYFCEMFDIDPKNVDVEYFILRNIVDEDAEYPPPRISQFKPSNGSISLKRVSKEFKEFIEEVFNEGGEYNKDRVYHGFRGRNNFNCRYCPYNEMHDLCPPENRIDNG